jgi:hypothetical protein
MSKVVKLLFIGVVGVLLAVSCASKEAMSPVQTVVVEKVVERESLSMTEAPAADASYYGGEAQQSAAPLPERMIIRTADMSIVVEDTEATVEAIRLMAKSYEGYIADSSGWLSDEQPFARMTIRVPAASLDEAMAQLRQMALRVDSENMSGQDVTEEYVDIAARLRNLEATETELLALLTEVRENRGKAEDILAIYRELTNVRQQIESLKGRSQYLERMTDLATISINIQPKQAPRSVVEATRWNPLVTLNNALRGFVRFFQVLLDLLIYVLIFSPLVLVPILVIWLVVRAIRRRRNR